MANLHQLTWFCVILFIDFPFAVFESPVNMFMHLPFRSSTENKRLGRCFVPCSRREGGTVPRTGLRKGRMDLGQQESELLEVQLPHPTRRFFSGARSALGI